MIEHKTLKDIIQKYNNEMREHLSQFGKGKNRDIDTREKGTMTIIPIVIEKKIKQEAIKRVKNCCPNNNVGGVPLRKNKRCIACERDIWFNNLIEKDLK